MRGDRRAHRRRAAVCRGTDQGGARIRHASAGGLIHRATSGIVGARDLARFADGAAGSAGTGRQGRCANGCGIGREFGYGLLTSVADLPEPQLREALDRLTNAGLLFVRGTPPQSSYIFKHALVQDAAYGTLLRSRRQQLHGRIAATLEDRFPEIVLAQPALLAQHCAEAGLAEKAVSYWLKAGQQALARSATTEAAAQLRKGLDVLTGLPDSLWRRQQELDLLLALRPALIAMQGWATADVEVTLGRARALAEQIDRPEYLVPLMVGQFWFHLVRADTGWRCR